MKEKLDLSNKEIEHALNSIENKEINISVFISNKEIGCLGTLYYDAIRVFDSRINDNSTMYFYTKNQLVYVADLDKFRVKLNDDGIIEKMYIQANVRVTYDTE